MILSQIKVQLYSYGKEIVQDIPFSILQIKISEKGGHIKTWHQSPTLNSQNNE